MTLSMSPAEAFGRVPSAFRGVVIVPEPSVLGRPCACGETCWANPQSPMRGVAAHNAGETHRLWWRREEAELAAEDPGVPARADTSRRAITRAREEER
jgi:hypothetical protein